MNSLIVHTLAVTLLLNLRLDAATSETRIIDFEGLSAESEMPLSSQIPGIRFEGVVVMTPALVRSSPGTNLSAATSGSSAASTLGARIHFNQPVIQVSCVVSPSFVSVPLTREASYHTAYLSAYAAGGTLIATATAPVIASISEPEHLQNFRPSTVAVSSSIPIQFVTLDFDDPFLDDGSRLLFDDLTLTVAEQVPLARPTLGIESLDPGRVVVSYDTPTARLQQTGNLDKGPWQSTPRPVQAGYVVIDPRTNSSMFFRALR